MPAAIRLAKNKVDTIFRQWWVTAPVNRAKLNDSDRASTHPTGWGP